MRIDKRWIGAAALVMTAVVWRVVNWHYGIAPNLELVTASTLVAATFLDRRGAWLVPLAIMVASDVIIGNSLILVFTWSAFALTGLAGLALRRFAGHPGKLRSLACGCWAMARCMPRPGRAWCSAT
jgi:hypothetical protein